MTWSARGVCATAELLIQVHCILDQLNE